MGKVMVMPKFASHWASPLMARPDPRIWLGNISPNMTHMTGPHDTLKNMTYRFAATRAMMPELLLSSSTPLVTLALANTAAMAPKVTVMPMDPMSSSGLRPKRSMTEVAIRQATMLTPPVMTLMSRASLSLKPADFHSTAP